MHLKKQIQHFQEQRQKTNVHPQSIHHISYCRGIILSTSTKSTQRYHTKTKLNPKDESFPNKNFQKLASAQFTSSKNPPPPNFIFASCCGTILHLSIQSIARQGPGPSSTGILRRSNVGRASTDGITAEHELGGRFCR